MSDIVATRAPTLTVESVLYAAGITNHTGNEVAYAAIRLALVVARETRKTVCLHEQYSGCRSYSFYTADGQMMIESAAVMWLAAVDLMADLTDAQRQILSNCGWQVQRATIYYHGSST